MSNVQDPSDAELAALAAVRSVEDIACYSKLDPGSEPTPDWRVKMTDARVADLEVTRVTDGQARSFWYQLTDKHKRSKEWTAPGLTHDWSVFVSVTSPVSGGRPAKELVAALVAVLREAEDMGDTPEEMAEIARERLLHPNQFLNHFPWAASYQKAAREGTTFEDWVVESSGYWYPPLLVDRFNGQPTDRRVRVLKAPLPVSDRAGRVRTYPSTGEGGFENEALLSAIQQGIDHKTAKGQMDNSPDQKWLAVILEGLAASVLSDHFGGDQQPPPQLHSELSDITFPYFNEVWAIAPQRQSLVVLRLSKGSDPTHTVVPNQQSPREADHSRQLPQVVCE